MKKLILSTTLITLLSIITLNAQQKGIYTELLAKTTIDDLDDYEMLIPGNDNDIYYLVFNYDKCHVERYNAQMQLIKSQVHYFKKEELTRCMYPILLENGIGIIFSKYDKKEKKSSVSIKQLNSTTLAAVEDIKILDVPGQLSNYGDVEAYGDSRYTVSFSPDYKTTSLLVIPGKSYFDTANPLMTLIGADGKVIWSKMFETTHISYAFRFTSMIVTNNGSTYFYAHRVDKKYPSHFNAYSIFSIDEEGKNMHELDFTQTKDLQTYRITMGGLKDGGMAAYVVTNFGMMGLFMEANTGKVVSTIDIKPDVEKWKANALYSDRKYTSIGMYFPARDILEDSKGNIYMVCAQYGTDINIGAFSLMVIKFNSKLDMEWYTFLPRVESSAYVGEYNDPIAILHNDKLSVFYSFIDPSKLDYALYEDGEPTKKLISTTMADYFTVSTKGKPKSEFLKVDFSSDGKPTYNTLEENEYTIDGMYTKEDKTQSGIVSSSGVSNGTYVWFIYRYTREFPTNSIINKSKIFRVDL